MKILNDKPGIPTKSSNIEKGKEKDEEEIFCHPQEDSPIGEVKDSDIMNNTPNADSKNETIDSNFASKRTGKFKFSGGSCSLKVTT